MRGTFGTIAEWLEAGHAVALATLVGTRESAPAPVGTTVAVDGAGRIAGNIGAGCYEGDVVEAALETIRDGTARTLRLDLSNADPVTGSAGCGGALEIAVWRPDAGFAERARAITRGENEERLDIPGGFAVTYPAKRRLLVVGATALAQELGRLGAALEYFVTVVDPRTAFATRERLPSADTLSLEWPDDALARELPRTHAVVVVSHDPKFDVPALASALRSNVPYVGLLGSRRTQAARREALRDLGVAEHSFERIHGPVGLDIGAETPAEIALSILAEIVAETNGRNGARIAS